MPCIKRKKARSFEVFRILNDNFLYIMCSHGDSGSQVPSLYEKAITKKSWEVLGPTKDISTWLYLSLHFSWFNWSLYHGRPSRIFSQLFEGYLIRSSLRKVLSLSGGTACTTKITVLKTILVSHYIGFACVSHFCIIQRIYFTSGISLNWDSCSSSTFTLTTF